MKTISQHFFLEVLLTKIHATADKYATLNPEGNAILFTTKDKPKVPQVISLAEGKRIFEDLYGSIEQRWVTSEQFRVVQQKKDLATLRRQNKHQGGKRNQYGVKNKGKA